MLEGAEGQRAAKRLLGRLLDKFEARSERKTRVIERAPPTLLWDDRQAF